MLLAVHGWIGELLETQLENLETLWSQWMEARRSPDWTREALRLHEERIVAHVDALVLAGPTADPLLQAGLGAAFWSGDLAAGHAMLSSGRAEPARAVVRHLIDAPPDDRTGVAMALRLGPIDAVVDLLRELASDEDDALGAMAGLVLVGHGHGLPQPGRLAAWRGSSDPAVAGPALLATALLPRKDRPKIGASEFEPLLGAPDPSLRDLAMFAGAALRGDWVHAWAREHAREDRVALQWFGVLATEADVPAWIALVERADLGPERFDAAASCGHPKLLEPVLAAIGSDDPATAVAAGRAFTRMTGRDISTLQRVALVEPGTSVDDAEFAEQAYLPDPERAQAHWDRNRGTLSAGTRWLGGLDFGSPTATLTDDLDLRSRFEESVRRIQSGHPSLEPLALERFPLG
jgi:hypothetical protein